MNLRRTLLALLMLTSLILSLTSCGEDGISKEIVMEQPSRINTDTDIPNTNNNDLKVEENSQTEGKTVWVDNTQDRYTGSWKSIFSTEAPEGIIGGGIHHLCSNGKGVLFKKYFFEEYEKNNEVLEIAEADGNFRSLELRPEDYGVAGSVLMAGSTAASDEFILYISTRKDGKFIDTIAIIDGEGNCIDVITPDDAIDLHKYAPLQMMRDADGNIYFWTQDEEGIHYFVLDAKGELMLKSLNNNYKEIKLVALDKGQVALGILTEDAYQLLALDLVTGEEKFLVEITKEQKVFQNGDILYVTCGNAGQIYCVTTEGIYIFHKSEGVEIIYLFRNHGISVEEICGMEVDNNNEITIIYESAKSTECLKLKPTEQQREIVEVPFAVSESIKEQYRDAIVSFNKKYPEYLITDVSYHDSTKLRTELIAGSGPVLVDTGLLDGFVENVELWERLDGKLLVTEKDDALLDKVQAVCMVDGKQYGVVTEWSLLTFASTENFREWNQEELLNYMKKNICGQGLFREQSPFYFLKMFFFQQMEECQYWDINNDSVYFETEEFRQLLELTTILAKELPAEERSVAIDKVRSGERLGEIVYILGAEDFAYYDAILGKDVQYIGFPEENNSKHYIQTAPPITICASATQEQKQVAYLFLEYLLSYEAQKEMIANSATLSVRKDVMKEYLNDLPEEVIWGIDGENFKFSVDKEKVRKQFVDIYENAVPMPSLPAEVENILEEELQSYFAGQQTIEQACSVLQNRMQLYLYEH